MKNLIVLALVATIVLILSGCSSRESAIQTGPTKEMVVTPKQEVTPLPKEEPKEEPKNRLVAVQKTAEKLSLLLAVLNYKNVTLLKGGSDLLPKIRVDKQGDQMYWFGYDGTVASTESPLVELNSLLALLCAVEKNDDKKGGKRAYPHRIVVSEEFTLLKRRAMVLRVTGLRTAGELEGELNGLEQLVEATNVLLTKLCNEVREAAAANAKVLPHESPLVRLGSARWFVFHLISAKVAPLSDEEARHLEGTVKACNTKIMLLNGVTDLGLTADGLALLDPAKAMAESKVIEPKALPETKPKPQSQEKQKEKKGVLAGQEQD